MEFLRAFEKQRGVNVDIEDELDTIDAFVALGGAEDKTGFIDTKKLVSVVKDEFGECSDFKLLKVKYC